MVFIIMLERGRQVYQRRSHIQFWHEGDVFTFHHFYEPFSHTVALRTVSAVSPTPLDSHNPAYR